MKKEVSYEKNPLSKEELDGLAAVNWPGRSQRAHHMLTDGRKINVFIDGAHTPGFLLIKYKLKISISLKTKTQNSRVRDPNLGL